MKKLLRNTLISAAALCSPGLASAAAVDFIDNGRYTTDTISGLDWLDVNRSTGKSYDYISNQFGAGQEFEGWRHATVVDFINMIGNFTDTAPQLSAHWDDHVIAPLMTMLSLTDSETHEYCPHGFFWECDRTERQLFVDETTQGLVVESNSSEHTWVVRLNRSNSVTDPLVTGYHRVFGHSPYIHQGNSPSHGHYLVRESGQLSPVPVPAALPLFASALAALGWMRRRTKKDRS